MGHNAWSRADCLAWAIVRGGVACGPLHAVRHMCDIACVLSGACWVERVVILVKIRLDKKATYKGWRKPPII